MIVSIPWWVSNVRRVVVEFRFVARSQSVWTRCWWVHYKCHTPTPVIYCDNMDIPMRQWPRHPRHQSMPWTQVRTPRTIPSLPQFDSLVSSCHNHCTCCCNVVIFYPVIRIIRTSPCIPWLDPDSPGHPWRPVWRYWGHHFRVVPPHNVRRDDPAPATHSHAAKLDRIEVSVRSLRECLRLVETNHDTWWS